MTGEELLLKVEKGEYTLEQLPPRELMLVQLQYHKQHKTAKVIELSKIAKKRRETGWVFSGRLLEPDPLPF